jgi:hypothetical protein
MDEGKSIYVVLVARWGLSSFVTEYILRNKIGVEGLILTSKQRNPTRLPH